MLSMSANGTLSEKEEAESMEQMHWCIFKNPKS